ncbi:M48 family metalloprotease [bacterium]|nr:M48 family metalloprotease [bacterium]
MKLSIILKTWGFISILTLIMISCTSEGDFNLISTEQEIAIGDSLSKDLDNELDLLHNPTVVNYVDSVGQNIVSVCGRQDITYYFKVVDNDTIVNAFACPGGWIYIYTGLMRRLDDESELAGVLAHEVSHVVCRHSARQLSMNYTYYTIVSLLLGENPELWEELFVNILGTAGILHFSREYEFEADSLGNYYHYIYGYDPEEGMLDVLNLLGDLSEEPSLLGELFSTHPPASDRIERVEGQIETFNPEGFHYVNHDRYNEILGLIGGHIFK